MVMIIICATPTKTPPTHPPTHPLTRVGDGPQRLAVAVAKEAAVGHLLLEAPLRELAREARLPFLRLLPLGKQRRRQIRPRGRAVDSHDLKGGLLPLHFHELRQMDHGGITKLAGEARRGGLQGADGAPVPVPDDDLQLPQLRGRRQGQMCGPFEGLGSQWRLAVRVQKLLMFLFLVDPHRLAPCEAAHQRRRGTPRFGRRRRRRWRRRLCAWGRERNNQEAPGKRQ